MKCYVQFQYLKENKDIKHFACTRISDSEYIWRYCYACLLKNVCKQIEKMRNPVQLDIADTLWNIENVLLQSSK